MLRTVARAIHTPSLKKWSGCTKGRRSRSSVTSTGATFLGPLGLVNLQWHLLHRPVTILPLAALACRPRFTGRRMRCATTSCNAPLELDHQKPGRWHRGQPPDHGARPFPGLASVAPELRDGCLRKCAMCAHTCHATRPYMRTGERRTARGRCMVLTWPSWKWATWSSTVPPPSLRGSARMSSGSGSSSSCCSLQPQHTRVLRTYICRRSKVTRTVQPQTRRVGACAPLSPTHPPTSKQSETAPQTRFISPMMYWCSSCNDACPQRPRRCACVRARVPWCAPDCIAHLWV